MFLKYQKQKPAHIMAKKSWCGSPLTMVEELHIWEEKKVFRLLQFPSYAGNKRGKMLLSLGNPILNMSYQNMSSLDNG